MMKNIRKLTREDLKNVTGGRRACSVTMQQTNGTWVTYPGQCTTTIDGVTQTGGNGGTTFTYSTHQYCETGQGEVTLSSNGGVSNCNG